MSKYKTPPDILRWRKRRMLADQKEKFANRTLSGNKNPLRFTSACPFAYSYSYSINGKCLDCAFCYKQKGSNHKRLQANNLDKFITGDILNIPVIVSTSCDPMYSLTAMDESLKVVECVLTNGGKIVYKTAKSGIDPRIYELASVYKTSFLYQPRFVSTNSLQGNVIKNNIAKNFDIADSILEEISRFKETGCQIVPVFDPVILHINDHQVKDLVINLKSIGINKIILKQLFATDSFRSQVLLYNPEAFRDLNIKIGDYYTYDSLHLLEHMKDLFDLDVKISFCSNHHLNRLLDTYNCCQFEGQNTFYRNDVKFMNLAKRKEKICLT
jgi:hypothetical protein